MREVGYFKPRAPFDSRRGAVLQGVLFSASANSFVCCCVGRHFVGPESETDLRKTNSGVFRQMREYTFNSF